MAILQKEQGTAYGRGFAGTDTNGVLAKFFTWVTKSAVTGGPAWFIISDHSADGTDPYIVISDIAAPGENDYNTSRTSGAPKIAKIGYHDVDAAVIFFETFCGFDGSDPQGILNGVKIETVDAGYFSYYFKRHWRR